jgi:DNA replication and repair protein RecF
MRLEQLDAVDFRNYARVGFRPEGRFTALVGPNGVGKTNLLDAIHYCGLCRSARKLPDALSIRHGQRGFRVAGRFRVGADEGVASAKPGPEGRLLNIAVVFKKGQGKVLQRNGEPVPRLAEHIGSLPMVFLGPEDQQLVDGYAEERRRLMDASLGQVDRVYLQALVRYNRALAQRNALLKEGQGRGGPDQALLDALDPMLDADAEVLREGRKSLLEELEPLFARTYARLSGERESPSLEWRSNWAEAERLSEVLHRQQGKDEALGYTGTGPHRDDLILRLDGHPARKLGSQGQKKSLLLALRLAQAEWLTGLLGFPPLLLLDDVFDKLDRTRARALFALLGENGPQEGPASQVILSDTNAERVARTFADLSIPLQLLEAEGLGQGLSETYL